MVVRKKKRKVFRTGLKTVLDQDTFGIKHNERRRKRSIWAGERRVLILLNMKEGFLSQPRKTPGEAGHSLSYNEGNLWFHACTKKKRSLGIKGREHHRGGMLQREQPWKQSNLKSTEFQKGEKKKE